MDDIERLFAQRVSNPGEWYRRARALFASARASNARAHAQIDIADQSDMDRVTSMLYGLGLECVFKVIVTLRTFGDPHGSNWRPSATFPKDLATHDLQKLAALVDKNLAKDYALTLAYFTDAIVWMGRYPCSKQGQEGSIVVDPRTFNDAEAIYAEYCALFSISG